MPNMYAKLSNPVTFIFIVYRTHLSEIPEYTRIYSNFDVLLFNGDYRNKFLKLYFKGFCAHLILIFILLTVHIHYIQFLFF